MIWYIKQLFPLTYESKYQDLNGKLHNVKWKMWMGKCFDVEVG